MKGTGRLKKWSFPALDWDALLKAGHVEILESDMELLNETELVEIIRLFGVRVDRSYGIDELRGILRRLGKGLEVHASSPVDILRDRLIAIYEKYRSIIRDQLPPECEFKCYEHPDSKVMSCYLLNQEKIEEDMRAGRK